MKKINIEYRICRVVLSINKYWSREYIYYALQNRVPPLFFLKKRKKWKILKKLEKIKNIVKNWKNKKNQIRIKNIEKNWKN